MLHVHHSRRTFWQITSPTNRRSTHRNYSKGHWSTDFEALKMWNGLPGGSKYPNIPLNEIWHEPDRPFHNFVIYKIRRPTFLNFIKFYNLSEKVKGPVGQYFFRFSHSFRNKRVNVAPNGLRPSAPLTRTLGPTFWAESGANCGTWPSTPSLARTRSSPHSSRSSSSSSPRPRSSSGRWRSSRVRATV